MKTISSRENAEYKALLKLAEGSRESRKQGRALLDGPHLVAAYRAQVGLPEMLLISESGLDNDEIEAIVAANAGSDMIVLKDALFKSLSGVSSPVGVAAVIAIPTISAPFTGGSCVLLDAVQDAGNVGSIMRSSAAAGVRDIFLGPGCAGAWSPRVLRAAQGAHFRLQIRESVDLEDFVRSFKGRALTTVVSGGVPLRDAHLSGHIAWVFGSEGRGVRPSLVALASQTITIPMAAETESLNVAAAAAICLFASAKPIQ